MPHHSTGQQITQAPAGFTIYFEDGQPIYPQNPDFPLVKALDRHHLEPFVDLLIAAIQRDKDVASAAIAA